MTATVPNFSFQKAIRKLGITLVPFDQNEVPDDSRGYSYGREMALKEGAPFPEKTKLHEMAHIVLGHTSMTRTEYAHLAMREGPEAVKRLRALHEVEAESTAVLLAGLLGFDGKDDGVNYMAGWMTDVGGERMPEASKMRVAEAMAKILKAGQ